MRQTLTRLFASMDVLQRQGKLIMTKYDSDRPLRLEPFDWDGFIAKHKLGRGLRRRYRVIPLDPPITAAEFEVICADYLAETMSDKWDITFIDGMLVINHSWFDVVAYLFRFVRDGDGYRICDMLENCNPHYSNGGEFSPGRATGWAVSELASLLQCSPLNGYRFEWQDGQCDEWSWYSPPKRTCSKLRRMERRMPSIRSAFQRSILRFLADCWPLFRVPFRLLERTRDTWRIRFEGLNLPFEATFIAHNRNHYQVLVEVALEYGLRLPLVSFSCAPKRFRTHWYYCGIMEAEGEPSDSDSLENLWSRCLWGPFLSWATEQLPYAEWLVIDVSGLKPSVTLAEERPEDKLEQGVIALKGGVNNRASMHKTGQRVRTVDPMAAHHFSSRHRADLEASTVCGCFCCLSLFPPAEITEWMDEEGGEETALCPRCGIDAVIGDGSGFPVSQLLLIEMSTVWFQSDGV